MPKTKIKIPGISRRKLSQKLPSLLVRRKEKHQKSSEEKQAVIQNPSHKSKKQKRQTETVKIHPDKNTINISSTIRAAVYDEDNNKKEVEFPVTVSVIKSKSKAVDHLSYEGLVDPACHIMMFFSKEQLADLYFFSSQFREIAKSGEYVYAADRLIIYHPKCVVSGEDINSMKISEDVAAAPYKYSLTGMQSTFAVYATRPGAEIKKVPKSRLYSRLMFGDPEMKAELSHTPVDQSAFIDTLFHSLLKACAGNGSGDDKPEDKPGGGNGGGGGSEPPSNLLRYIITSELERLNMSIEDLAEYLEISPRTISRFWTRPDARPALNNVIAICIGLHFPPTTSDLVLSLTGYCLRNIPQERAYRALINVLYTQDIHVCNRLLLLEGLQTLTPA